MAHRPFLLHNATPWLDYNTDKQTLDIEKSAKLESSKQIIYTNAKVKIVR